MIKLYIEFKSQKLQLKHNKIYQALSASLFMQAKTHTAFPLIESKLQPYNPKIAVLSAVNKLKQTQEKILQAKHRQVVQKRIEQSILAREDEKKKNQFFKKMVRKSVDLQKERKHQSQTKKQKEVEKLHELNMTFRQSKFRFRQTVKSIQKQQNHQIYEQTKSQRQKNQELVKEFKKRQLQLKRAHRQRMSEREQKSKERVEEFRQSRILFIQKERQKDVQELENKISSKTKYLQKFIQSQSDFAKSRTRLRYRSNSSLHNDEEKTQSDINQSNVGKIVENFKINSMVNPENEAKDNIFGLTESKKQKTISLANQSEKQKDVSSVQGVKEGKSINAEDEIKQNIQEKQQKAEKVDDEKEELQVNGKIKTANKQVSDLNEATCIQQAKGKINQKAGKKGEQQKDKEQLKLVGAKNTEKQEQINEKLRQAESLPPIKAQGFKTDQLKQKEQQ